MLPDDIKFLPDIEKKAAGMFIEYGLEAGVFEDARSIKELQIAQKNQLLWVAEFKKHIVGFAFAEKINSALILSEIDVLPAFMQQGIGTALINDVFNNARKAGYKKIFLTTFKDIPWNYPFYKKIGFKAVKPGTCPSDIEKVVCRENQSGLDRQRRVVMVYWL